MKKTNSSINSLHNQTNKYQPKNPIRIVTAASLFDGHDAAINIMRRMIQNTGVEVIHLGHDRSVEEVVNCAIQEDAQAIAMTSYQGGHNEYFKFMYDLLLEKNANHIKIFGGGGGVILPSEIRDLMDYGITRIYSPDDGRIMGLQGMINDLVEKSDFPTGNQIPSKIFSRIQEKNPVAIGQLISAFENNLDKYQNVLLEVQKMEGKNISPIIGITGTGGAGKSSLVDELVLRYLINFPEKTIAIISIDPTKRKTGGALLGDRIRMNSIHNNRVYMRSMATREQNVSISKSVTSSISVLKAAQFDVIILETSGIGQSGAEILDYSDIAVYAMTPEYGAASQLEKIDMLDYADLVAINKSDKKGSQDAIRDVKKQYQRNHMRFDEDVKNMPVFPTQASKFNDAGTNVLFTELMNQIQEKNSNFSQEEIKDFGLKDSKNAVIIPAKRERYLSEIAEAAEEYQNWVNQQSEIGNQLYALQKTMNLFQSEPDENNTELNQSIAQKFDEKKQKIDAKNWAIISTWEEEQNRYRNPIYQFQVRDKIIEIETHTQSLSLNQIPKISTPKFENWGDILRWNLNEGLAGKFPYTAGIYPFKRQNEDPTRMFAGEGGPERTNKRFHYVSLNMEAKRLSTAFDSVTLYGQDPGLRPDVFGKIGNAGVSIATLDDAKKLYSGFDLCKNTTSVSMTINGPAPMLLGYFLNAAIDQQCEKYIIENGLESRVEESLVKKFDVHQIPRPKYIGELPEGNNGLGLMLLGLTGDEVLEAEVYQKIKIQTLNSVRGTVQADILKEDQAQNTCIFSTEFALRLMGDVQEYFIENSVRNFYSVSISGYHIAEAGANPISQLAFTLSNGFTYVEYYLSRGMHIDDFAPNLSFFFSNGIDPEYAVIGRVARRIWSKAMKFKYGGNKRSQMLKYHIQTSGRSLHAQEIAFNDIRTTLQALYAIYDNCNSLHTNAYDEAITTPTEESVRRAMAIQLIINKELGLAKNENPLQGSFIIEELTDLVEEAVYAEFDKITERGGVLGAMETMYQRSKIQEESLYYEGLKHSGEYPIIGVNTFLSADGSPTVLPKEVIRSTEQEKQAQIANLENYQKANVTHSSNSLKQLSSAAYQNHNMFDELMQVCKFCTLGQITNAMFELGGKYRRSM